MLQLFVVFSFKPFDKKFKSLFQLSNSHRNRLKRQKYCDNLIHFEYEKGIFVTGL